MLRILQERAKAGVEIQVIGQVAGRVPHDVKKLGAMRLHTRTIVRDRRCAFVGSQSFRSAELDSRREVGLIVQTRALSRRSSIPSNRPEEDGSRRREGRVSTQGSPR
jgi:phosphatidylserine/phosphatidylglycerophosphate/cardiolipin synthase-like enzyme